MKVRRMTNLQAKYERYKLDVVNTLIQGKVWGHKLNKYRPILLFDGGIYKGD